MLVEVSEWNDPYPSAVLIVVYLDYTEWNRTEGTLEQLSVHRVRGKGWPCLETGTLLMSIPNGGVSRLNTLEVLNMRCRSHEATTPSRLERSLGCMGQGRAPSS